MKLSNDSRTAANGNRTTTAIENSGNSKVGTYDIRAFD
jgi:hypothetical protein